jgi:hypothetical protein
MYSGHRCLIDEKSGEFLLFESIKQQLLEAGIACFEIDLPIKKGKSQHSDVVERSERLRLLLETQQFEDYASNFGIIALSLGGHATLHYLTDLENRAPVPRFAVLCSTVVDEPAVVNDRVDSLCFLYGEYDYVGYQMEGRDEITIFSPEEYATFPKMRLSTTRKQRVDTHIVALAGHLMDSGSRSGHEFACEITEHFLREASSCQ